MRIKHPVTNESYYIIQFKGDDWWDHEVTEKDTKEPYLGHVNASTWPTTSPIAREFSACGKLWQTHGVHGTYDLDLAARALACCIVNNPGKHFRLVHREVKIVSRVLVTTPHPDEPGVQLFADRVFSD